MFGFFQSRFYDFELTRLLGSTPFGGCDVAEFLEAIGKIKKHDPESWYGAWREQGEQPTYDPLITSARAPICSPSSDTRVLENAGRSIEIFREAIRCMDEKVMILQIPLGDGSSLPGYLYLPLPSKRPKGAKVPVLINCGGADATHEELYYLYVVNGVELGYVVPTFKDLGQGMVLRKDRIPMRPDYETATEKVLDHVVDIATTYPELDLDLDRIAVVIDAEDHSADIGEKNPVKEFKKTIRSWS
ncbi:Alpha/Beta hydrolase protein [Talaromyces proteolyticus]|uniref:Alpha/Beta hydrolase protein n=1 Tax=Talaromyces proteolyticus TaxID=1131652 RepID=A0AAD4PRU2_9EURO|nr:Alpha/Beta hydrolase protein [Talaromyces proteolyticus]KAH8689830.1 Alpha/Beta hydrolase protein [Talaromyces proteolyticus]